MSNVLRISNAASLALHAMGLLATNPERPLATSEAAVTLSVSENHLQKVMQRLHHAGLVRSIRGPHGGFELALPPDRITLMQVYEAIEGPLTLTQCLLGRPRCQGNCCILGHLVESTNREFSQYMSTRTVAQLAEVYQHGDVA